MKVGKKIQRKLEARIKGAQALRGSADRSLSNGGYTMPGSRNPKKR